ncbi:MAG: cysteine desulfurase [Flavobacteriaceae bacterium]|nr:cysteine desulfurase [Flavobacteriaceae bacterium]
METFYFDNAATTCLRPEVVSVMSDVLNNCYGNPSSTHSFGRHAKTQIENARKQIAESLGVLPAEIVFTSGGTEADNQILRGVIRDLGVTRIISSTIEHHAVTHSIDQLVIEYGIKADFVNLLENGEVDLNHLQKLLEDSQDLTLVSLMHINNEIGVKIDLDMVANLCKSHGAFFHSDTVQTIGHYSINLSQTPVDFLVASAHKFHGPKGVGFAFIRKNSNLKPLIFGGSQERGHRAGTESVHNIVGMAKALEISLDKLDEEKAYIASLKNQFVTRLKSEIPEVKFNGDSDRVEETTYTLVNVRLPISAEKAPLLLFQLDLKGIACSKGSACQSGSDSGSHVLSAILSPDELSKPSLRFSFSAMNTPKEIDFLVEVLKELIASAA